MVSPQAVVYEKPDFRGECLEVDSEVCDLLAGGQEESEPEEGDAERGKRRGLSSVGSLKILSGL